MHQENWLEVIKVLEKHGCCPLFLIECITAYYSVSEENDGGLLDDLSELVKIEEGEE